MTKLLVKFVALASVFMLLLPAGWCRGWDCCQTKTVQAAISEESTSSSWATATSPDSSPTAHGCCQKHVAPVLAASQVRESFQATAPTHSTVDCCCTRGKLVTTQGTASNELSVSPLAAIATVPAMVRDQLPLAVAVDMPFSTGPPLRILHCVWRC